MDVIGVIGNDFNDDRIAPEIQKMRQKGESSGGVIFKRPASEAGVLDIRFFIEATPQLPLILVASLIDHETVNMGIDVNSMISSTEMLIGMIEGQLDQVQWSRDMALSGTTIELQRSVSSLINDEENLLSSRIHFVRPSDIGLHGVPDRVVGVLEFPQNDEGEFEASVNGRTLYKLG